MPIERRIGDVVDLASIVLAEYQPGMPLYEAIEGSVDADVRELGADATFIIEVEAGGKDLRGLLAALDTIQLAVDAASAAVFYANEFRGHDWPNLNSDFLRTLAGQPNVTLEIVELADGSFKSTVKAVFRSRVTYATVSAVAIVSTAVINILFPPLIAPTLIVGSVVATGGIGGAIFADRAEKAQKAEIGELKQAVAKATEDSEALKSKVEELQSALARLDRMVTASVQGEPVKVDSQAIKDAQIRKLAIRSVDAAEAA
ncbi:MAG TPA: hypothetical protein VFP54_05485 [Acidimicrobiales bacterium]|nr:hypothetical protein [Acidimicrobiales bacterium]